VGRYAIHRERRGIILPYREIKHMKQGFDTNKLVEKELDRISEGGEKIGAVLGEIFRFLEKNLLGVIIIVVFGLLIFIYSIGKGFLRKRR
jgi:hypothetical protein